MTAAAHARALVRHRRRLARLIAHLGPASRCVQCLGQGGSEEAGDCGACEGTGDGRREFALQQLGGGRGFDVAAVRAYARELVALEVEHAVFVDWTRGHGLGSDNREPGAFIDVEDACEWISHAEWSMRGNPGPSLGFAGQVGVPLRGGWPGLCAREWPGDRRAPHGRSLARVGRRLLEALRGQPDECQTCAECICDPKPNPPYMGDSECPAHGLWHPTAPATPSCPDCHGTGHNLRGHLPEAEVTPAMMAACAESMLSMRSPSWTPYPDAPRAAHPLAWARALGITRARVDAWVAERNLDNPERPVTRDVPRGKHRDEAGLSLDLSPRVCARTLALGLDIPTLDERITLRGWQPRHQKPRWLMFLPRWRRGELLHARQRRERQRRAPGF